MGWQCRGSESKPAAPCPANEGGRGKLPRVLFVRPIGHPVPNGWIVQRIRVSKITFAVVVPSVVSIQSPEMGRERLTKKCAPVRLQLSGRAVRGAQQIGLQDDLDRLHMWTLVHIESTVKLVETEAEPEATVTSTPGPRTGRRASGGRNRRTSVRRESESRTRSA